MGSYDEAIQVYDKVIEINPKFAEVWYNKGTALRHLGKDDEASVCDDKAAALKS